MRRFGLTNAPPSVGLSGLVVVVVVVGVGVGVVVVVFVAVASLGGATGVVKAAVGNESKRIERPSAAEPS